MKCVLVLHFSLEIKFEVKIARSGQNNMICLSGKKLYGYG